MLARREQDTCPHCGQRMLMRHGVRFPPKLADIFDMIERTGEAGIMSEVLVGVFYPGKAMAVGRDALRVNISRINELLAGTDLVVRAGHHKKKRGQHWGWDHQPYRIQKRKNP